MSIKLDSSRGYSECRGDRTPDDPHYRVCYMQGGLPFDSDGNLVPDDGKTAPWMGLNSDGKPVQFHPLWSANMRALLEKKEKRSASISAKSEPEDIEDEDADTVSDDVNLPEWLRGHRKYDWALLVAACKKRYSRLFTSKREMVIELVIDQKLIPENEVQGDLAKLLPGIAA